MEKTHAGQVAVINGGAAGTGLAVTKKLAECDAKLSIWDLSEKANAEARAIFPDAPFLQVTLADYASVEAATNATESHCGRIDIVVNSAGIAGKNTPSMSMSSPNGSGLSISISPARSTSTVPCCRE